MSPPETLRSKGTDAMLWGFRNKFWLGDLARGSALGGVLATLQGARVMLRTDDPLFAGLALIELDGVAARIVIAPPDVSAEYLPAIIERAEIDWVVGDDAALAVPGTRFASLALPVLPMEAISAPIPTEIVLFTSGTTGVPKMAAHTLAALTGAIRHDGATENGATKDIVWGTFYDIRRYGGLQILLRALYGRACLVLSDAAEETGEFLTRLGRHGVTHLTGTPSHWRRALMSPALARIAPRYLRLSGEIADQAILDALRGRFPNAAIGHAYASTEAGVGFEVTDGLEGFSAGLIGRSGPVELKVENGTLHIRSPRTALGFVGDAGANVLRASDGFVDTGDTIELRGERYYFTGRRSGIINVGGAKINPEEVEAVINRHPGVRASRVRGRKSPITGALVVADVVLADPANDNATFRAALLGFCRDALPAFKVPASFHFVAALELTAGGKLARPHG